MIDTHAHIDFEEYTDKDLLIREIISSGVEKVIVPGVHPNDFERIRELCKKHKNIYAAIGVHPSEVLSLPSDWENKVKEFLKLPEVVAVGEIGLDYYREEDKKNAELQKEIFIKQINIANEFNLPILVHDRDAHGDTFEIIDKYSKTSVVMHCFSGSAEFAKRCVKRGFYLAFGGVVTFKNAKKTIEAVKEVPLEKLLLETDSPFLTPEPYRGKTNSPVNLKFIAEKLAQIKETDFETINFSTTRNAYSIFNFGERK